MHPIRSHRRLVATGRIFALLLIVSLLGSTLPAQPVRAIEVQRTIDDTLADFSQGNFQRTALVDPGTVETTDLAQIDGTVQLAQIGTINELETAFQLPERLRRFGAAAIGNRIYIAGGERPTADGESTEFSGDVWSAAVNLNLGPQGQLPNGTTLIKTDETNQLGWRNEGTLPPVVGRDLITPITRTHSFGIAAVDNPTGNDYLYLIGGEESSDGLGSNSFSSRAVRIGVVAGDADAAAGTGGRITRWITSGDEGNSAMRLPSGGTLGAISPAVTTFTVNGTTYLYVFGGLGFTEGNQEGIRALGEVHYARVGSDGRLYKPGTSGTNDADLGWTELDRIPGTNDDQRIGLFEAAIMKSTSILTPTDQSVYLLGGRQQYTSETQPPPVAPILQARINPVNGTLQWIAGGSGLGGNLPIPLRAHTAVEYRGSIFVAGGEQLPNEPTQNILASYLEDDQRIHLFKSSPSDPGTNFLVPSEDNPTFAEPRGFHQSLTIESFGSAIVYVLGGVGNPNDQIESDNPAASTVFSQRIISDTLQNPVFINRGWYVSRPLDIALGAPKIIGITWNAEVPRPGTNTDLRIQYRTSTQACENADWTEDSWQTIDGSPGSDFFSNNGSNSVSFDDEEQDFARCFQYRGEFTGSDDLSPQLLNLSINIFSESSPDLFIEDLSYNTQTGQLSVLIRNRYQTNADLTEDADADAPTTEEVNARPVFLDAFIIGTGYNSEWFTPTLPLSSTVFTGTTASLVSQAYTSINLNEPGLSAGQAFNVPTSSWRSHETNKEIGNFDTLFDQGTYQICVAVDSYIEPTVWGSSTERREFANVTETLDGAEANNTRCTEEFTIVRVPPTVSITPTINLAATRTITEGDLADVMTVRRDALSLTGPLTVSLSMSGSAERGTDYDMFVQDAQGALQPITTQVVLPAGRESVTLIMDAIGNELVQDDRTVTTQVVAPSAGTGSEYDIDPAASSVTITIADDDPYRVRLPLIVRQATE